MSEARAQWKKLHRLRRIRARREREAMGFMYSPCGGYSSALPATYMREAQSVRWWASQLRTNEWKP